MRTDLSRSLGVLVFTALSALGGLVPLARAERSGCDATKTRRVLFVGNSFTYFHNVPEMVKGIGASLPGPCIETAMIAIPGAALYAHWASDSVAARIRQGGWTHVVLNDQSMLAEVWAIEGVTRVGSSGRELDEYGKRFINLIRESHATPVLMSHWANDDAPPRDQQALDYQFDRLARSTHSLSIPAGFAVKQLRRDTSVPTPYFDDAHHLSPVGSYLVALTTYATITGVSPVGASSALRGTAIELSRGIVYPDSIVPLVNVSPGQAASIQRVAWGAYQAGKARTTPVPEPTPLANEIPKVPDRGQAISRDLLRGKWTGWSRHMTSATGEPATVDFVFESGGDSARVRLPSAPGLRQPMDFGAKADVRIDGDHLTISAQLGPENGIATFRCVMRDGALVGVGELVLGTQGSDYFVKTIGRFELRRAGAAGAQR